MGIVKGLFSIKGLITAAIGALLVFVIGGNVQSWFQTTAAKIKPAAKQ
jgi:hypothetical protein